MRYGVGRRDRGYNGGDKALVRDLQREKCGHETVRGLTRREMALFYDCRGD